MTGIDEIYNLGRYWRLERLGELAEIDEERTAFSHICINGRAVGGKQKVGLNSAAKLAKYGYGTWGFVCEARSNRATTRTTSQMRNHSTIAGKDNYTSAQSLDTPPDYIECSTLIKSDPSTALK